MSLESPFFSVVLATWNRAARLPAALDSTRSQTFEDWETLIVDDGSEDDTENVVRAYLEDTRFRYVKIPHSGVSGARNAGVALARGLWTTFLDSDDIYERDHLESRRRFIERNPEVSFIHGGFRLVGPPEAAFVPDARDPSRLIPIADCAVGGTFVIRTDILKSLGGFPDVPYAMDFHLLNRASRVVKIGVSTDPTYVYIREPGEGMCEEMRVEPVRDPS